MHWDANLTLMLSRSRSTYDHHLNKLGRPHNLNATYQGHQPSGSGEILPYMGTAAVMVM